MVLSGRAVEATLGEAPDINTTGPRRILCFGDSNTWGYMPGSGHRYPLNTRWTGIVSSLLGDNFTVIENGLNGRTTIFDDYYVKFLNGKEGLGYALASQKPLDLLILSLGTNDLRFTDAIGSSKGLEILLRMIIESNHSFHASDCPIFAGCPCVLVVSPIHMCSPENGDPENTLSFQHAESLRFAEHYGSIARQYHAHFLDAALYAKPCPKDGIHMDAQSHTALGQAIANKVLDILHFSKD